MGSGTTTRSWKAVRMVLSHSIKQLETAAQRTRQCVSRPARNVRQVGWLASIERT